MLTRYMWTTIVDFFKMKITMIMMTILVASSVAISTVAAIQDSHGFFLRTTAANFDVYIKLILSAVTTLIASIFIFADVIARGYESAIIMNYRRLILFVAKLAILIIIILVIQIINSIASTMPLIGRVGEDGFIGWYASSLLGPIVFQILVASITVAFVNFRSKQTTLISLLLVFVAGPLTSMVIQHTSYASPINVAVEDNMYEYDTTTGKYVNSDYYYYDYNNGDILEEFDDYSELNSYGKVSMFDIAYQAQMLSNIFKDNNYPIRTDVFEWEKKEVVANVESGQIKFSIVNPDYENSTTTPDIDSHSYHTVGVLVSQDEFEGINDFAIDSTKPKEGSSLESRIKSTASVVAQFFNVDPQPVNVDNPGDPTYDWLRSYTSASIASRLLFTEKFINGRSIWVDGAGTNEVVLKELHDLLLTANVQNIDQLNGASATAAYAYIRNENSLASSALDKNYITDIERFSTELISGYKDIPEDSSKTSFSNLVVNGATIIVFDIKNYVEGWMISIIWGSIIMVMFGIGFLGFIRRDISKLA